MLTEEMAEINMDKCTESFTVKIPEILKVQLDKLPPPKKTELKQSILYVMAKALHENNFNPAEYLSSRD